MKNKFCTLVNIIIANPTQVDLFFNHVQFKDSQHQRQLKQMKEVIVINITLINSSLGQLKSLTIYTNKQMFFSMNEAKRIKGPSLFLPKNTYGITNKCEHSKKSNNIKRKCYFSTCPASRPIPHPHY